ncbi:hypothetical protein GCM10007086_01550 [Photobacterium aphoticum]|nr:hypothetical protein GCM10007086_01550 [Photobacterium aphoticum]
MVRLCGSHFVDHVAVDRLFVYRSVDVSYITGDKGYIPIDAKSDLCLITIFTNRDIPLISLDL